MFLWVCHTCDLECCLCTSVSVCVFVFVLVSATVCVCVCVCVDSIYCTFGVFSLALHAVYIVAGLVRDAMP